MNNNRNFLKHFGILAISALGALLLTIPSAKAQETTSSNGAVVSTSNNTVTIRNTDGQYRTFVFDRRTNKPATLAAGTQVRITSIGGDEDIRVAREIVIVPSAESSPAATSAQVVPPEVRRLERDIERQARRLQLGVRAGVGLDPELILLGVQSQVGPFFSDAIYFRPNVEFGFGEVTALFAINPEFVYRLPLSSRYARWSTYFGIGPGFNFVHQNFERINGNGSRIDFGEFKSDVGLNLLGGIRYRSGTFMELKTSVYSESSPTLRLVVGYNF